MKQYNITGIPFDGSKFRIRYPVVGQDGFEVHNIGGQRLLQVYPTLPDDPPIFEAPDPPLPELVGVIQAEPSFPPALKNILIRLARNQL